jgi:MFS family permease
MLLLGSLAISTGYGMLLLLPLYVVHLGGNEADFGLMMAVAAVPAAIAIGFLVRFPDRIAPQWLLAGSIAVYGMGAGAVAASRTLVPLYAVGIVLGTAWAVVYTTTPMVVADIVPDERRAVAFGFATGSQQLGIGLGPVIGMGMRSVGLGLPAVFASGAALAGVGALAVVSLRSLLPRPRVVMVSAEAQLPLRPALREMLRSAAAVPLLLILLSACLFTTLTFFQTTYAAAQHLSSDVFYVTYTAAVIAARFGFSRLLTDRDPSRVAAWATTLLTAAMASFLLVGSNAVMYAAASAATGIGYGLALPLLQSQAVALSPPRVRGRALPVAGLLFETAVLAFPAVAGVVIAGRGYQTVFTVLLAFALVQTTLTWRLPTKAQTAGAADRAHSPWGRRTR